MTQKHRMYTVIQYCMGSQFLDHSVYGISSWQHTSKHKVDGNHVDDYSSACANLSRGGVAQMGLLQVRLGVLFARRVCLWWVLEET